MSSDEIPAFKQRTVKPSDLEAIRNLDRKREISVYEVDVMEDEKRLRKRDDYSKFGGCHKSTTTTFFLPPLLGWRSKSELLTTNAKVNDA